MTGVSQYCKTTVPFAGRGGGRDAGRPAAAGMLASVALHLLVAAVLMLLWGASGGVRHTDLITVALAPPEPEPVAAQGPAAVPGPPEPETAARPAPPATPAAAPVKKLEVREVKDEPRENEAADREVDEVREDVETPAPGGESEPGVLDVAVPAVPRPRSGGEVTETASITEPVPASGMSGSCCGPESELRALKDEYAGKLKDLIERFVDYPVFARRARLEGTCMLVCRINAGGELLGVNVEKSAGHDVLDRAAMDAVRDVGRFPPVPYMEGEGVLDVTVPVSFSLDGSR